MKRVKVQIDAWKCQNVFCIVVEENETENRAIHVKIFMNTVAIVE